MGAGIEDTQAATIDNSMRDAAGLLDADGQVAAFVCSDGNAGGEKSGLDAAAAKTGERAGSEEAADAVVNGHGCAAGGLVADQRKEGLGIFAMKETFHDVEDFLGDGKMFGEALGDGAGPEFGFVRLRWADSDVGRSIRGWSGFFGDGFDQD